MAASTFRARCSAGPSHTTLVDATAELAVFLLAGIDERRMAATRLVEMRALVKDVQQSRMALSVKEGAEAVFDSAEI